MKKIIPAITTVLTAAVLFMSIYVYAALLSPSMEYIGRDLELVKSGVTNNDIYFSENDFVRATGVPDIEKIVLTSLPDENSGTLMLGDTNAYENQTVSVKDIEMLHFEPKTDVISNTKFGINVESSNISYPVSCEIKLLEKVNAVPTISEENDRSFTTLQNVSYFGKLDAADPDSDALSFEITKDAKHGSVKVTDNAGGSYKYTPTDGFTGKDSFSYCVCDPYGNYSEDADVSITVQKNASGVYYCDMKDSWAHNAAIALADKEIMTGETIGKNMLFGPDYRVSRAEFVAMTMDACKIEVDNTLTKTEFKDNDEIPEHLRSHIATAAKLGYITGTKTDDGVFFYPNNTVTRAEAAVILNKMLDLQTSGTVDVFSGDSSIPTWASGAINALSDKGIINGTGSGKYSAMLPVTREQAAAMLYEVIKIK